MSRWVELISKFKSMLSARYNPSVHVASSRGIERAVRCTMMWQSILSELQWNAPITLEQVCLELEEAAAETDKVRIQEEIGDALHVLVRYAQIHNVDLIQAVSEALDRNMLRTTEVIRLNGGNVPETAERMKELWGIAKKNCS